MKVTFSALISNYSTSAVNLIEGMTHDVIDARGPRGIRQENLQKIDSVCHISTSKTEHDNLQRISEDKKMIIYLCE
jgi:hypothetical protein